MNTEQIRDRARQLIKQMFGTSAEFRPGQLEAIEHIQLIAAQDKNPAEPG